MQTSAFLVPFGFNSRFPDSGKPTFGWNPHTDSPQNPPLLGSREDRVDRASSGGNLHGALVRVGAEVLTGFCAAWAGGDIGENTGMLIGALAGTLFVPGVGTAAGAALGGATGELVGVLGGAVIGTHLGAMVAGDLIV